jgi:hypothetical protein
VSRNDGSLIDGKGVALHALKCFGISHLSVSKVVVLEGSMEGKDLVITCTLAMNNQELPTHPLIDCAATGSAFIDHNSARHYQAPLQELKEKKQYELIDGRPIESAAITYTTKVGVNIKDLGE